MCASAMDCDKNSSITKEFFAKVRNKMHFAVHGHTAAALTYNRADAQEDYMGLTSWANGPEGRILKKRLNIFLQADDRDILTDAGKISAQIAKDHAESRVV